MMKLFSLRMLMIVGLSLSCAQPMMAMETDSKEEEESGEEEGSGSEKEYPGWITQPYEELRPILSVLEKKSLCEFVNTLKQEAQSGKTVVSQEKQNAVAVLEKYLGVSDKDRFRKSLCDKDGNYLYTKALAVLLKEAYNAEKSESDQVDDCNLYFFKISSKDANITCNDLPKKNNKARRYRNSARGMYNYQQIVARYQKIVARSEKENALKNKQK